MWPLESAVYMHTIWGLLNNGLIKEKITRPLEKEPSQVLLATSGKPCCLLWLRAALLMDLSRQLLG